MLLQRCLRQQLLFGSCSKVVATSTSVALLQPNSSVEIPKRHLFWKKREYWKESYRLWMYHDYKWNFQEWKAFINRKTRTEQRKSQEYNWKRVHQLKPNLAAAEFFMTIGGKVKFMNDENWYQKYERGALPTPRHQDNFFVEGIDASGTDLMDNGLDYLYGLDHLLYLNLADCKYVDDWYVESLLDLSPHIEALDISGCQRITDDALEMIHRFPNLQVLKVSGCSGIKCGHVIASFLEEFRPELSIIGLDTLQKFDTINDLESYEKENSRFMNWGLIMNKRLELNNEVDFEKVVQTGMEKMRQEMSKLEHSETEEVNTSERTESKGGNSHYVDEKSSAVNG